MDRTDDIAAFLASRRANVTPEQAGLHVRGKRRVPGLRREEVATLAGVSIDYYKRLERGKLSRVSDSARFTFLGPAATELFVDWERTARDLVAHLRSEAGRNPYHRGLGRDGPPAADGLTMAVYTAEPGTRSAEALDLLASWAATPSHESIG